MTEYQYKVDGYDFGERILEGAMFDVTVNADTQTVTGFELSAEDATNRYFDGLNMQYWLNRGRAHEEDKVAEIFASGEAEEIFTELNPDGTIEF